MTQATTERLVVHAPVELVRRLDEYAAKLREAAPGVNIGRGDAVRSLLLRALEAPGGKASGDR